MAGMVSPRARSQTSTRVVEPSFAARTRMASLPEWPAWTMLLVTSSLTSSSASGSAAAPKIAAECSARRADPAAGGIGSKNNSIATPVLASIPDGDLPPRAVAYANTAAYLTLPPGPSTAWEGAPASRRGTSTSRLNSATRTPSWLWTRVWTLHGPAIGLGLRLALLEHLGLDEQGVAVEDRRGVLELLGGEVGDRLARDVGDAHPQRQRVDERPHDHVAALLGLRGVDVVDVQRVVVHGDEAEEVVVGLGHRLGGPVLVDGPDLELLEVAPVGVRPAGLAGGLVGLHRRGRGVGHRSLPWSDWGRAVNHAGCGQGRERGRDGADDSAAARAGSAGTAGTGSAARAPAARPPAARRPRGRRVDRAPAGRGQRLDDGRAGAEARRRRAGAHGEAQVADGQRPQGAGGRRASPAGRAARTLPTPATTGARMRREQARAQQDPRQIGRLRAARAAVDHGHQRDERAARLVARERDRDVVQPRGRRRAPRCSAGARPVGHGVADLGQRDVDWAGALTRTRWAWAAAGAASETTSAARATRRMPVRHSTAAH